MMYSSMRWRLESYMTLRRKYSYEEQAYAYSLNCEMKTPKADKNRTLEHHTQEREDDGIEIEIVASIVNRSVKSSVPSDRYHSCLGSHV